MPSGSERFKLSAPDAGLPDGPDWTSDWFQHLYRELRFLAHAQRNRYRDPDSPGTTSIVHEAYERLHRAPAAAPENPLHFYRTAARTMRSVLIDNARRARAVMHGGEFRRVPDEALEMVSVERGEELLALDDALERLEAVDSALSEIVQLRIFGGLTIDELANLLGISAPTVKRRWRMACGWLFEELSAAP